MFRFQFCIVYRSSLVRLLSAWQGLSPGGGVDERGRRACARAGREKHRRFQTVDIGDCDVAILEHTRRSGESFSSRTGIGYPHRACSPADAAAAWPLRFARGSEPNPNTSVVAPSSTGLWTGHPSLCTRPLSISPCSRPVAPTFAWGAAPTRRGVAHPVRSVFRALLP
jgi:hypothetical protein